MHKGFYSRFKKKNLLTKYKALFGIFYYICKKKQNNCLKYKQGINTNTSKWLLGEGTNLPGLDIAKHTLVNRILFHFGLFMDKNLYSVNK